MVEAIKHWDIYLHSEFTVFTKNQAVSHLMNQPQINRKQTGFLNELQSRDFHIVHIPRSQNQMSDFLSKTPESYFLMRATYVNENWTLNPKVFSKISQLLFTKLPEIDLFATKQNHQVPVYFSKDPEDCQAKAINAFSQNWTGHLYANPPFSLFGKVLSKLQRSIDCTLLLIFPLWNNSEIYFQLKDLLLEPII